MNFICEWSTQYLTSEHSERVRYRNKHEKIKFISKSECVLIMYTAVKYQIMKGAIIM